MPLQVAHLTNPPKMTQIAVVQSEVLTWLLSSMALNLGWLN